VFNLFVVKLNGGRQIQGILRGFDPFMNLVVDESIEETKLGEKNTIGMVVCYPHFISEAWISYCLLIRPRKIKISFDGHRRIVLKPAAFTIFMLPFEEEGTYRFAAVSWSVCRLVCDISFRSISLERIHILK
ncbi:hypothetical protein FSP39_014812, partial [Pinctada imbricata]